MSEFGLSNSHEAQFFMDEARRLALAESNPAARLELLQALISEGDVEVVGFAVAALQEQTDYDTEDPAYINDAKITGAHTLVETLAGEGLFDDADSVIDILGALD